MSLFVRFIRRPSPLAEFLIVIGMAFGLAIFESFYFGLVEPESETVMGDVNARALVIDQIVVLAILLPFLHIRGWGFIKALAAEWRFRSVLEGAGLALAALIAQSLVYTFLVHGAGGEREIGLVSAMSLFGILLVVVINSFYEEFFVTGYVISVLQRRGLWMAINVSTILRVSYHLYQGPVSGLSHAAYGVLYAYFFARTGRLWPLVVAHGLFNLVAFTL